MKNTQHKLQKILLNPSLSRKTWRILVLCVVVFGGIFYFWFKHQPEPFQKISAEILGKNFEIELAVSDKQRSQGLMYRENLEEHQAMLFVFPREARHGFWMKNTKIPLKILWISEEGFVTDIARAEPCATSDCPHFLPKNSVKYVLEVTDKALENIRIGDRVLDKNLLNLVN